MPAEIIDLHQDSFVTDLSQQISDGLTKPEGNKYLPTLLLYDELGLRLYDDITTRAQEYYLFKAEEDILKDKADEIVQVMHAGKDFASLDEVVLELGAGALRKTSHILLGLSHLQPAAQGSPITYFALDLDHNELKRTLGEVSMSDIGKHLTGRVETKGIWGTYDDGLAYVRAGGLRSHSGSVSPSVVAEAIPEVRDLSPISTASSTSGSVASVSSSATPSSNVEDAPVHILFLGSSLGNFTREDATSFLVSLPLRPGSGDTLLIGLDQDNAKEAIEQAYHDKAGYTEKFIMNGLVGAGRALGDKTLFDSENWEYVNSYNPDLRQHEAFYRSKRVQVISDPITKSDYKINANEVVKVEESFKYSEADAYKLFTEARLRPIHRWANSSDQYSLWLVERPFVHFPLLPAPSGTSPYGPFGIPSRTDWLDMWKAWDLITLQMIPSELLFQRPIDLRHICLFYIGHIPTFLDIHLSRLLNENHTEPEYFKHIFERGIDPNVDDPSKCHAHSEVPKQDSEWPSLPELLSFRNRVRERVLRLYDAVEEEPSKLTRKIGRVLWMGLEHEALHAETLLYMLMQRAGAPGGTLPPAGLTVPPFKQLAEAWNKAAKPEQKAVTLGPTTVILGHDDSELDDEKAGCEGVEFGWDNENPKREVKVEEFWIEWRPVTNGEFYEFYTGAGQGKVTLPASWVEDEEGNILVRSFFESVSLDVAFNWPVITDYDSLSTYATVKGGRLPTEPELRLFMDKFHCGYEGGSANVGFRNWHPVPATTGDESKKGHNGGVWEWTSTVLEAEERFEASKLYPGYSRDFHDGCHNVVLGGSYATIPRISERRSFRNWYQRNYPYAFVSGRVAYDLAK